MIVFVGLPTTEWGLRLLLTNAKGRVKRRVRFSANNLLWCWCGGQTALIYRWFDGSREVLPLRLVSSCSENRVRVMSITLSIPPPLFVLPSNNSGTRNRRFPRTSSSLSMELKVVAVLWCRLREAGKQIRTEIDGLRIIDMLKLMAKRPSFFCVATALCYLWHWVGPITHS